ncbi:MAG: HPr(Ser) kinase/phosphatase [Gemmatimonadota bacterium]|nr:HPr(Ser) kinase/phosphatase [Gemmatimonadota bacterium]
MVKVLRVADFFSRQKEKFELCLFTGEHTLESNIINNEVSRPGLVLVGFIGRFAYDRTLIFGETEIAYLESLPHEELKAHLEKMTSFDIPCMVVSKGLKPPELLIEVSNARGLPVLGTTIGTQDFHRKLADYLGNYFAPHTIIHGTLADVYGVGLLYTGPSGIGKSECVLDLVERGHRLVCDDVVHVIAIGDNNLVGTGNERLSHHMEIRGLGIIDVFRLFGIRAVRARKRIEVVVRLERWDKKTEYDRTGLDQQTTRILNVELPQVTVPLVPGKNITVISEVIAMNYLLKLLGHHTAEEFNRRLLEEMNLDGYIDELTESSPE